MNTEQERADFEAWVSTQGVVTKYGAKLHRSSCGNHYKDLRINQRWLAFKAGRAALESPEVQALWEDAERYRWLRDPCSGAEYVIFYSRGDYGKGLMSGAMLDEAIDASMEKQK